MKINKVLLCVLAVLLVAVSSPAFAIPVPDDDGNSGPWIAQYSVSYTYAKVGNPVHVQWQSFFTNGCTLWTNQTGSRPVPSSSNTTVTPTSPTTMSVRLTCAGIYGQTTSQTRAFSVNAADHPELLSLNVSTTDAEVGEQVSLSWSSSYGDFCELTGTNTDTLPANGTRNFFVLAGTNTFQMVCKRYDGRSSNPLSRSVVGQLPATPVILRFYIDYSSLGDPFYYVRWNADADFCILDNGSYGSSGSVFQNKVSYSVPHILTCFKNGASVSSARNYTPGSNGIIIGDTPIPIDVP